MLEIAKREANRASEKQSCTWCGFVCNCKWQKLCSRFLLLYACRLLLAWLFRSESIWFADVTRSVKVGVCFGGYCYSTGCSTVDWIEVTTLTLRSWGALSHECASLLDSKAMLGVVYAFAAWMSHRSAFVILAKLLDPTRLETRTKESNICASIRVANSNAQWKWFLSRTGLRSDPLFAEVHDQPMASSVSHESYSMSVRTRKMVNYAWAEWSQRKLWWKLEAILTCKSFVWLGYRGERLIEPSSSWFPAKFPSG